MEPLHTNTGPSVAGMHIGFAIDFASAVMEEQALTRHADGRAEARAGESNITKNTGLKGKGSQGAPEDLQMSGSCTSSTIRGTDTTTHSSNNDNAHSADTTTHSTATTTPATDHSASITDRTSITWAAYQTVHSQQGWAPETVAALYAHIGELIASAELQQAISMLQAALKDIISSVTTNHGAAANVSIMLANCLYRADQWAAAVKHYQWCLPRLVPRALSDNARHTCAMAQTHMGDCLIQLDRCSEALPYLQQAHPYLQSHMGSQHDDTMHAARFLAQALYGKTPPDYAAALPLFRQCLDHHQQRNSQDAVLLTSMSETAQCLTMLGDHQAAMRLMPQLVALSKRVHGPEDLLTHEYVRWRAGCCLQLGKPAQAQSLLLGVLHIQKSNEGLRHPDTIHTARLLGQAYRMQGRWSDAAQVWQTAWESADGVLEPTNSDSSLSVCAFLLDAYDKLGQKANCKRLLKQARVRGISQAQIHSVYVP